MRVQKGSLVFTRTACGAGTFPTKIDFTSNIGITLDTYSHVLPGLQEAAARAFDEVLEQAL